MRRQYIHTNVIYLQRIYSVNNLIDFLVTVSVLSATCSALPEVQTQNIIKNIFHLNTSD